MKFEKIKRANWIFYLNKEQAETELSREKVGKWMYFFTDKDFASKICENAVANNVVCEAKHSIDDNGVCCFYLNGDDIVRHKKVIQFFIDNGLIKKTKTGKLYNISFKYDRQTKDGIYGDSFVGEIKLENFLDLETREWKK